jgi:hypothetical protein
LLASFKDAYRIVKCKNKDRNKETNSIGESSALPVATDADETALGESHDRELRKIPLADNILGKRISEYQKTPF